MPKSPLTPEQWKQVERAAIAGVPIHHILSEFGITKACFLQRAHRGDWPLPTRISKVRARVSKELSLPCHPDKNNTHDTEKDTPSALELARNAAKDGVLASSASLALRAVPVLDKWTPGVPESTKEAAQLVGLLHKCVGLDRQAGGTNVQVNVAVGPWGAPGEACRDISA